MELQGLTPGFRPQAGTYFVFADFGNWVDLELRNATSFHVHNSSASTFTAQGNDTLIG